MINATTPELLSFLEKCDAILKDASTLANIGPKYVRIVKLVRGEPAPLPLCFINRATGEVLLAIKWSQPSFKYPRGNIFDSNNGVGDMTPEGLKKRHNGCPKGFKHTLIYPRGENKILGPQERRPKELKGHAAHRPERIRAHKTPLIEVMPVPVPTPSRAVAYGILPGRIFTPKTHTED